MHFKIRIWLKFWDLYSFLFGIGFKLCKYLSYYFIFLLFISCNDVISNQKIISQDVLLVNYCVYLFKYYELNCVFRIEDKKRSSCFKNIQIEKWQNKLQVHRTHLLKVNLQLHLTNGKVCQINNKLRCEF